MLPGGGSVFMSEGEIFFATDEKMQNTLGTLRLLEGPRTKKNAEQREELKKKVRGPPTPSLAARPPASPILENAKYFRYFAIA